MKKIEIPDELKGKSLISEEAMQELASQAQELNMGYELRAKEENIANFPKEKDIDFPEEQELFERILALVHEYDDDISVSSSLGVLDFVKDQLISDYR